MCVTITTLGYGEKTPCDDEFENSKALLDGRIKDESVLTFVSSVDDPENWEDEAEWFKANPNLEISISLDRMREDFETAKTSPRKREEFKCKRLNIKGNKYGNWIPLERFKAGKTSINWEHFRGRRCFGGLDLGISKDLSAAVFAFQDDKVATMNEAGVLIQPAIYLKALLWVPEVGLEERYKNDGVPYAQWVEQGFIIATPGETRRSDIIRRDIREQVLEQFDVAEIAADQSNAHELMTNLADDGATVVKHSQSFYAMNFPCSSFETAVIDGRIHYDNPVLEWCLGNVAILRNAQDEIKIAKDKSRGRVDPIVALCMGLGRLMIAPEPTNFVYNFMGIYSK